MTTAMVPYLFLAFSAVAVLFFGLKRQPRTPVFHADAQGYSLDSAVKNPMDHYHGPWE